MSHHFIDPMLAAHWKEGTVIHPLEYAAEEKFNGHRIICSVARDRESQTSVVAWSRNANQRLLPPHIVDMAPMFPDAIYDGEMFVPGRQAAAVTELVNAQDLVYVVFDILEIEGVSLMMNPYDDRRVVLERIFRDKDEDEPWRLARSVHVADNAHADRLFNVVKDRGGEGIILKHRGARYFPGERPKGIFMKRKVLRYELTTVIGYLEGLNGPYSRVLCEDQFGVKIRVKTKNNLWLDKLAKNHQYYIGKKLWVEFQDRTPDGRWLHPRWDRWDDE